MKKRMIQRLWPWGLLLLGCLFSGDLGATDYYYHYYYNSIYNTYSDNYCGYDEKGREERNVRYKADQKKYDEEALPAWNAKNNAYQAYLAKKADYDKRYAEYLKNKSAWEQATGVSGVGTTLDLNSYVEGHPEKLIVNKLDAAVEVPSFSDISTYRSYCQQYSSTNGVKGGTLTCRNKYDDGSGMKSISFTYQGENREEWWSSEESMYGRDGTLFYSKKVKDVKVTRTVAEQNIVGGYAAAVYPFTDKIDALSDACEKSSVVLIGTLKYPIELNGPVYVDGDVVIRGFVRGQGSIYAGRNIHIIGDITYYNPPSWPHDMNDLKKAENQPDKVRAANKTKDLLLLAARGNIIVGDYTSVEWTNKTQLAYLNLSGKTLKAHATSEPDIGYSAGYPKNKNYTETDGGKTIGGLKVTDGPNDYGPIPGMLLWRYYYIKTYDYSFVKRDRRYYESSLGDAAIQGLKQTSAAVGSRPTWQNSTSLWKRILTLFGLYQQSQTVTDNTDSGDVTEIDAILYANHGIFGVAGGSKLKKLHLNGAMICKDEGLLTSFAGRFKDDSSARAWINWDMRIKSDLDDGLHIGAPEKESENSKGITVKRVSWAFR